MSIQALHWALSQRTGKPHLKLVLLVLADVANEESESWHSQQRLSELTEVPVRTLRRYLEELERLGLLERTGRSRPDGKRSTDVYRLPCGPAANLAGGPAANGAPTSGQALAGETEEPKVTTEPKENRTETAPLALVGVGPPGWMHAMWVEELGNGKRTPPLTPLRRQKYQAMFDEQLQGAPDPRLAWRVILRTVKRSPHHMSNRAYQMPESLLRNPERRDTWVEQAVEWIEGAAKKDARADSFAAMYRARRAANGA